jgi:hypothetical protein
LQNTHHYKIHVITKYTSIQNNVIVKYGQCNLKKIDKSFLLSLFLSFFSFLLISSSSLFLSFLYPKELFSLSLPMAKGHGSSAALTQGRVRRQLRCDFDAGVSQGWVAGEALATAWDSGGRARGSDAEASYGCGVNPAWDNNSDRWGTFILPAHEGSGGKSGSLR